MGLTFEGSRHGVEARLSAAGRAWGAGGCGIGSGLTCGGVDSCQGCGCDGGEVGSRHDGGFSELGCCEESELACGEMESLRRLELDFFFLTFFMGILLG